MVHTSPCSHNTVYDTMNESSSDQRAQNVVFFSHSCTPSLWMCWHIHWHIHRPILLEFRPLRESKLNNKKQQYIYLLFSWLESDKQIIIISMLPWTHLCLQGPQPGQEWPVCPLTGFVWCHLHRPRPRSPADSCCHTQLRFHQHWDPTAGSGTDSAGQAVGVQGWTALGLLVVLL